MKLVQQQNRKTIQLILKKKNEEKMSQQFQMITNFWILYIALFSCSQLGMSRGGFIKLLVRRVIHNFFYHFYILVACASATCFCNRRWWASNRRSCRLAANGPARALRSITLCFNRIFSRFGSDADFCVWRRMKETRNGNEIDNYANFSFIFVVCNTKLKFFFFDNKSKTYCVDLFE